jgi:putative iron-regulated protein
MTYDKDFVYVILLARIDRSQSECINFVLDKNNQYMAILNDFFMKGGVFDMKKIFALALSVLMVLSLVLTIGCEQKKEAPKAEAPAAAPAAPAAAPAAPAEAPKK